MEDGFDKAYPELRDSCSVEVIEEKERIEKSIRIQFLFAAWLLCLLLLLMIPYFSFDSIRPESMPSWFERFGAIVCVISILIERRLKKAEAILRSGLARLPRESWNLLPEYYVWLPQFERISLCLAVFGALIWAYGSLIYSLIFN